MTTMKELNEKIATAKRELAEKAGTAVNEAIQVFFEENPTIAAIRWSQYTPYFNDGDPCVFSRGEVMYLLKTDIPSDVDLAIAEPVDLDGLLGDEFYGEWRYRRYSSTTPEDVAIRDFEDALTDEVAEAAFGDHVEVIALPGRILVEEYDHE